MNNIKQLFPCLDSIKKYTTVSYEVIVTAYLFSVENKTLLYKKYPWVKVVESDEIRGFSENNNLALDIAKGEYCFVLNDDTLMIEPVIDSLVADFDNVPQNTALISPHILNLDGSTQVCGRPQKDWRKFALELLYLWDAKKQTKFINGEGLFQSYNILGAAFLIKTSIFKSLGWFDEYYFFCPEDIALSTKLNKNGYTCYVDAEAKIIHLGGISGSASASMVQTATRPAAYVGSRHFYAAGNRIVEFFLANLIFIHFSLRFIKNSICYYLVNKTQTNKVSMISYLHILQSIFSTKTPKEIFIHYYSRISK